MGLRRFLADLLSGRSPYQEEFQRVDRHVFPLTIEEARAQFEGFLRDPAKYTVVETPPTAEDGATLDRLPASVRELFRRFARIEGRYSDTWLVRDEIGPSSIFSGTIRIGRTTDAMELVVRPPEEGVYVASGLKDDLDPGKAYPSINHYLLVEALDIYTDDLPKE